MIARMWEARGLPESIVELVAWVRDVAVPAVESDPDHVRSDIYAAADRVVVISHWSDHPRHLPEPPTDLVARDPHSWDFERVAREA
ncbi:MAG TPA: hypothetical protein VE172_19325 [Stackebrandtia sp.]|jgi:hypothetical protein|uniref:hypothetical protein n=1 Tax=Stackebrandtia sp. TaxID=2023065 RepID=UPI002D6995E7|nr:hypothetical protein [Stackebrandtia sp.]HZE40956.1 hypothetical protein [Stackebrandtia sp.]